MIRVVITLAMVIGASTALATIARLTGWDLRDTIPFASGLIMGARHLGKQAAGDREPDGFGCAEEGGGIHTDHMRRDRVRRHTETATTFPVGEDA